MTATKRRRAQRPGTDAPVPGAARHPGDERRLASEERRRALLWMVVVAAVAAAARLAYIAEVHANPLQMVATADPRIYDLRALEILAGGWVPREVFFHSSPLYPYILAGIYAVFGHSYLAVRLIQSAFGVATCLVIFQLTRRLFGVREAAIAGFLSALYVAFIFFDSELLMITLVLFFSTSAVYLLVREQRGAWSMLGAGLLTGLASLGKPNILLFVPVALVWFWWSGRSSQRPAGAPGAADQKRPPAKGAGRGAKPGSGGASTSLAARMVLFAAGAAVVIAPFTISNYRVSGELVLTTSNGGINFFIGNNEDADGTFLVDQSMRTDLYGGSKRWAERELGRDLGPAEVSSYWLREGLDYAKSHPAHEMWLLGRKLLLFWNAYEIPNHYDINFFKTFSRVLRFDPFLFAWMIPFGFLGIYVSRRRWRELLPLYLFAGVYMVSLVPFFITSRYRLPVVPVMLVFAAVGVWWVVRRIVARDRHGWIGAAVVLTVSFVIVNLPLIDFTLGPSYAILGSVYRDMGEHEEAVEQYRLAIKDSPGYDMAYSNLASELGRLGRYKEAESALSEALKLNPLLVPAHSNLGVIYMETGRLDKARAEFERAVELDPDHSEAWEGLARLGMAAGDGPLIERALLELLRIDPQDGAAHWNLAVLYSSDPALREKSAMHARAAAALLPAVRPDAERLLEMLQSGEGGGR